MQTSDLQRCSWCDDELLESYHDREWGYFPDDDYLLFEAITLEIFQAGLSWKTILHKRKNFRSAFDSFNFYNIAQYNEREIQVLMQDKGIVRNRRKIEATIYNASICIDLTKEYGSLTNFVRALGETEQPLKKLSETFKHVGKTTAESILMAIGIMKPLHEPQCFLSNG